MAWENEPGTQIVIGEDISRNEAAAKAIRIYVPTGRRNILGYRNDFVWVSVDSVYGLGSNYVEFFGEYEELCNCARPCCSGIAKKGIEVSFENVEIFEFPDGYWAENPDFTYA